MAISSYINLADDPMEPNKNRIVLYTFIKQDYEAIVKYMEIILGHGSTEDDGVDISDVSLKKKIVQHSDDEENSDTSQSFDSEICAKTAKKHQKKFKNAKDMSEDSDFSHVSIVPKKKQKQDRWRENQKRQCQHAI